MKQLIIVALCCFASRVSAHEGTEALLRDGQMQLEHQEYAEALKSFESVIEQTDIDRSSQEARVHYLEAAYHAAMISDLFQNVDKSEQYRTLFTNRARTWFGSFIASHMFECNELGRVWRCANCNHPHPARYPNCENCGHPVLKERYEQMP